MPFLLNQTNKILKNNSITKGETETADCLPSGGKGRHLAMFKTHKQREIGTIIKQYTKTTRFIPEREREMKNKTEKKGRELERKEAYEARIRKARA